MVPMAVSSKYNLKESWYHDDNKLEHINMRGGG
jgi:hypothetical protein